MMSDLLKIGLIPEFPKQTIRTFIYYDPDTGILYEELGPRHLTPQEKLEKKKEVLKNIEKYGGKKRDR